VLSVSFHVPTLSEFFGGCAGNIAYGLRLLGAEPIVLAAAGRDFGAYAAWLDRCGIRRDAIRVFEDAYTAQCFITTDLDDNQIAAFHPGAMERAPELRVEDVTDPVSLAIVAPDDPRAMRRHAAALKRRGVPTVVDPGQQLINFEPGALLDLLEGARVYVANDYEWAVTLERTGFSEEELAKRAGAIAVTRGAEGATILADGRRLEIPPARAERVVDPTGCGDAWRAGLLYALERGHPLEVAGRVGSLMGALAVEVRGTQSVEIDRAGLRERWERAFAEPCPIEP
jgi:adenosine kinase